MKIYTITVLEKLGVDDKGLPDCGIERVVGYYADKEIAIDSVKNNTCDIFECLYQYVLVEEVKEGLYNPADKRWLFQYNFDKDVYEKIDEPEWMKKFTGFSIG